MNARGWKGGYVRRPLRDVTEEQAREIARVVATVLTGNFSQASALEHA